MTDAQTGLPLPHAYPFLLLDRVIEVDPGRYAVATKNLTWGDPLMDGTGHVPPVLLAEAMAEVAGIAAVGLRPGAMGVLARLDRFRSRAMIGAGGRLVVRVDVLRIFGVTVKARGVVRIDGHIRAAADLMLQLASKVRVG